MWSLKSCAEVCGDRGLFLIFDLQSYCPNLVIFWYSVIWRKRRVPLLVLFCLYAVWHTVFFCLVNSIVKWVLQEKRKIAIEVLKRSHQDELHCSAVILSNHKFMPSCLFGVDSFVIDQNHGVCSRSSWSVSSLYVKCVGLRNMQVPSWPDLK